MTDDLNDFKTAFLLLKVTVSLQQLADMNKSIHKENKRQKDLLWLYIEISLESERKSDVTRGHMGRTCKCVKPR